MDCPKCQAANREGRKFCTKCGSALERRCPSCGTSLEPLDTFCGNCGAKLDSAGDPDVSQSSSPVPPSGAPQGERRQATVLFSDLSGYTAMNERLDPEEVRGIVARIKAGAVRIVESHGGIVNQFVGDEVLALFGIPNAHEDDPVRAVRAARDLHAMVRALSPEVEDRIGAPLRMHTGISTGLVVTSTEDRRDGTFGITGDTVNTGARLASNAASDTVLVSEETQRGIADYFQTEPLEPVELKGKSGRVTPYRVIEQTGVSSRFEAAEHRGFTAFAGREAELAVLQAALEKARVGQGQFVTVLGEPGVGKSRLLFEFRHGVPRDRATVLTAHCQPYGTDTPYLPIVDSLRRGLRLEDAKGTGALHGHVVAAVRAISPVLERYLPQYLHLLSIPSAEFPVPKGLQGDALRRAFEEAFAAIVTENARRQPLVLILEDWHWADEASDSAIKHLAGLVPHHPLQLVVTYRPEYERKWSNPENYTPLVLRPLGEAETAAMLRSVWKAERLPEGLAAQVHFRTGGNALFNEEVARALGEDQKVRVKNGDALLAGNLDKLNLPDSVQAVIRARVDRLDPESREVLRRASVIGREFTRPLLERLHPAPQRIPAALEGLARQNLINPLRVVPEPAYLFKHALVQDVMYETLLHSQRKQLHEQAGAAIEALYSERLEEHYESLAGHYSKTDNVEKAVEYLDKAGTKATGASSMSVAQQYYAEAISILDSLTMTAKQKCRRIDIALKWASASFFAADHDQLKSLERSIALAKELNDAPREVGSTNVVGRIHYTRGNFGPAMSHFERCIAMASSLENQDPLGLPYNIVGRSCLMAADYGKGIEYLRKGVSFMRRQGAVEEATWSNSYLALLLGWIGEFPEAFKIDADSLKAAGEIGSLALHAACLSRSGCLHNSHGSWPHSIEVCEGAVKLSRQVGILFVEGMSEANHGYASFMNGRAAEGLRLQRSGIRRIESRGSHLTLNMNNAFLAEMLAISNNSSGALDAAEKSVKILEHGERWGEVHAHRARALAYSLDDAFDGQRIEHHLHEGRRIAELRAERPSLALIHFRHAEILHKRGEFAAAKKLLAQAEKLFAEMEMTWWSEQAAGLRARIEGKKKFVWFAPYVDGPPEVA